MIKNITGYSYNDLTLVPATISNISSRSECNPFLTNDGNYLPIFTAPMASVVNIENIKVFENNHIYPIIPRNIPIVQRMLSLHSNNNYWVALSLNEFKSFFIDDKRLDEYTGIFHICVDIANGHMEKLYELCKKAKLISNEHSYKLVIMTGNIANPNTYRWICDFNYLSNIRVIDYIRVGIGGGSGCITTSNVSIHYPQASLIDECYHIKQSLLSLHNDLGEPKFNESLFPKIVADGGIRNYDHVIKALALGADYVMVGSLFAQCIESAGDKIQKNVEQKDPIKFPIARYKDFYKDDKGNWWGHYTDNFIEHLLEPWKNNIDKYKDQPVGSDTTNDYLIAIEKYNDKLKDLACDKFIGPIDVKFFGMASADGQKSISGIKTKTSEGITKYLPVKYTLKGWTENMISYLRSAMSYTNCTSLDEFIGKQTLIVNSISEIYAVNK